MSTPLVDAHCHLWIAPPAAGAPRLTDERLARAELSAFREGCGVAVIDCQPGGAGRDGRVLGRLAAETGVEIAPATGFHMPQYYSGESPYGQDPERLTARWVAELRQGLREEPAIRARVVKSAWTGADPNLMRGAAAAAREGGGALVVHTERGEGAELLAELLLASGLPPERVQISHVDKRFDPGLHLELARAGFTLGYDAFLRPKYEPDERTWPLLRALAGEGLHERVTVGLDLVDPGLWSAGGGQGLPAIGNSILPRLRAEIGDAAAEAMVGANALRLIEPAEVSA